MRNAKTIILLAGALQRAGFDGAAGRRAAKQRIERILRRGSFGRARRTGLRRHQFEIRRDDQGRLTLHSELVGPLAAEHAAAAAGGEHARAQADKGELEGELGGLKHSSISPRFRPPHHRPARWAVSRA